MAPLLHSLKSPSSARSPQAQAVLPPPPPQLCALLLNSETQEEGEELLDYSFPPDDEELRGLARMRGVIIASCGVMRSVVGSEATTFSFWSADGKRHYKLSLRRLEKWIICIALPGSTSDRLLDFFADEAVALVLLRHGKLSSLQGHFRQLDRIFRALGGVWQESLQNPEEAAGSSSLFYASLGVLPWSHTADTYKQEVSQKVCEWEIRWQDLAREPQLAQPEGFALFLGQTLMATSLADRSFEACLRLCLLEGTLEPASSQGHDGDDGSYDVRCHSLFLQQDESGAAILPSHQYSILRHGPWLLFMLWQMAALDPAAACSPPAASATLEGETPKTPAKALLQGSDPFGVDLCLELLSGLTLPPSAQAATRKLHSKSTGGTGRESRRGFTLSCPSVFKPHGRRSRGHSGGEPPPPRPVDEQPPPPPTLCAMELEAGPYELPREYSFSLLQRPFAAARHRLSGIQRPSCPEMVQRAAGRSHTELPPTAWAPRELISEWRDLLCLGRAHEARRASWVEAPSPYLCRHPLLGVLKTSNDFERLWDECLEESSLTMLTKHRHSEANKLGDGHPWRFQVGAPFFPTDLPPLISCGALTTQLSGGRTWVATSTVCPTDLPAGATAVRQLLLRLPAEELTETAASSRKE